MIRLRTISLSLLTILAASSALAAESRDAIIAHQLDCMDRKLKAGQSIDWNDICSTTSPVDSVDYRDASSEWQDSSRNSNAESSLPVRNHTYEIAAQVQSVRYRAADKSPYYYTNTLHIPVPDKVKKSGTQYGVHVAKTWNPYGPLESWGELWKRYELPNFIKVELEGTMGHTDYSSYWTGKLEGYDTWDVEGRVLAGYDFVWGRSSLFTPFLGVGYQRMEDDTGGWEDFLVRDYTKYTNSKSYFYVPVGVETLTKLNNQWDVNVKLEGDVVVYGSIDYHLNDIPGPFNGTDLETGLPVTVNPIKSSSDLKGGYGFRTSVKIIRKFAPCDFYVEPFFRFLYLNKSEAVQEKSQGTNGKEYVSAFPDKTSYENLYDEKNYTTVVGVRSGIQF